MSIGGMIQLTMGSIFTHPMFCNLSGESKRKQSAKLLHFHKSPLPPVQSSEEFLQEQTKGVHWRDVPANHGLHFHSPYVLQFER